MVDFLKKPGISETLDWAKALRSIHQEYLYEAIVLQTLGCILKYQDDILKFKVLWSDDKKRRQFLSLDNTDAEQRDEKQKMGK